MNFCAGVSHLCVFFKVSTEQSYTHYYNCSKSKSVKQKKNTVFYERRAKKSHLQRHLRFQHHGQRHGFINKQRGLVADLPGSLTGRRLKYAKAAAV